MFHLLVILNALGTVTLVILSNITIKNKVIKWCILGFAMLFQAIFSIQSSEWNKELEEIKIVENSPYLTVKRKNSFTINNTDSQKMYFHIGNLRGRGVYQPTGMITMIQQNSKNGTLKEIKSNPLNLPNEVYVFPEDSGFDYYFPIDSALSYIPSPITYKYFIIIEVSGYDVVLKNRLKTSRKIYSFSISNNISVPCDIEIFAVGANEGEQLHQFFKLSDSN